MPTRLLRILLTYIAWVIIFVITKGVFVCVNGAVYSGITAANLADVVTHGLPMDMSMAAYLTVIPAVATFASIWGAERWTAIAAKIWFWLAALMVAMGVTVDAILYSYWNFKLDVTPLFYFLSSPSAAMASAPWWQTIGGCVALLALTALIGWAMTRLWRLPAVAPIKSAARRAGASVALLATLALLILAIRGGLTVSTMNLSSAYFSSDTRLNHAAVNPLFSFIYSCSHQDRFADQFRYFDEDVAARLYAELGRGAVGPDYIAEPPIRLKTNRPDIYLVLLESFSSHLLPSLGGEPVAMKLDSIARQSTLFTNFYASSFRTDRALAALLSAYPAQPNTSIMKYVEKTDSLPSLPRLLRDSGYDMEYYYGGDINFTNMKAFLVSAGFGKIVSDKDFPVADRLSKWGVHDDRLLAHATSQLTACRPSDAAPRMAVIQTSSSHEPFEVPFTSHFDEKRLNAFAYVDCQVGQFVDSLSHTPLWDNALVILVADHYGAWPMDLPQGQERHRIPLVMTGGALDAAPGTRINTVASQTDIAATLLAMMGIPHGALTFSRDIFSPGYTPYAWFCNPEYAGLVNADSCALISVGSGETISGPDSLATYVKAYLQTLYNDLDQR